MCAHNTISLSIRSMVSTLIRQIQEIGNIIPLVSQYAEKDNLAVLKVRYIISIARQV